MAYRVLHQWLYGKRRKREAPSGILYQFELQPPAKAGLLDMDVGINDSKFRVNGDKSAVYVVAKASSKVDCQIIDQLALTPSVSAMALMVLNALYKKWGLI